MTCVGRASWRAREPERLDSGDSGDSGSPDTAGDAGDGPFLVRMFRGRADAAPADADLRVLAEDVFGGGAFGDATVVSVADGAQNLRLRVRFAAPRRRRRRARRGARRGSLPRKTRLSLRWRQTREGARAHVRGVRVPRVSESPMHFAGLDAATGLAPARAEAPR